MFLILTVALLVAPALASWNRGDCGVQQIQPVLDPEDRVVGGAKAVPGSWPWHAQLRVYRDYCSGVLISDRHVLTAAHCAEHLRPRTLRVHLGAHLRSAPVKGQVFLHVKEICVHPGYDGKSATYMVPDIAIIELVEKVNMTTTIQPACLPKSGEDLPEGSKLYATGWGDVEGMGRVRSEELKQTMIESIPIDSCIKRWGMASHPDVFCAAHDHGSICDGDSGGPAVHKADGKWTVHGIVSTGPRPCNWSISPQGFVKVSAYIKDFIEPYMDPSNGPEERRKLCQYFS
ncbi:chymotrypsin-like protease CTRL-1 [Ixodes scapularis]|uniref:chymotrypsin-like protease CTRL-1 n=1 Tax=Ixodes scapularis TaxID=6945 RepID=UPI001A9E7DD2|nr:chymotrypsin-like protease CTRL-1 [Ixodes scapularis]